MGGAEAEEEGGSVPSSSAVVTMPGLTVCTPMGPPRLVVGPSAVLTSAAALFTAAAASFARLLVSCGMAAFEEPYAALRGVASPRDPAPSTLTTIPPLGLASSVIWVRIEGC